MYIIMSYLNCAFSTLQLRASNVQVMCFINPRGRHRTRPYNKTQYTRITLMRLTAQSKLTLATQSVQIYPGVHKPFHTHPHGHTRTKRHTQKTQTHTHKAKQQAFLSQLLRHIHTSLRTFMFANFPFYCVGKT